MKYSMGSAVVFAVTAVAMSGYSGGAQAQRPSPGVNATPVAPDGPSSDPLAGALAALDEKTRRGLARQVALDRAGFSPGEIDGAPGANTDRAMAAFKAAHGTAELGGEYDTSVTTYTITAEDAAGPFTGSIPDDMMEKSKLPALGYASILELLGERFHVSPKLLQRLNPKATFAAGEVISVPNVEPFVVSPEKDEKEENAETGAVTVIVTDRTKTLQVQNSEGKVIFHAPVTVGSANDPLPVGEWKINGVGHNPVFHYNPDLFWDADPTHAKAKIAPGPNNPVGVVWIDLSKEHYGIHGTPEPSRIGYSQSHGCIRLTNWDAMRVAALVKPGTKVILQ